MKTTSGTFASQLSLKGNLLLFHRSWKGILWKLCLVVKQTTFSFFTSKVYSIERRSLSSATRTAKKQQIYIRKTITLQVHHAFFYICLPSLHDCDMNIYILISRARFMEQENTTQIIFSFSKLRYVPFRFNPRKFRQHYSTDKNEIQ